MTPDASRLTVDDVRHHAEEVRDLALAKVNGIAHEPATKAVIIGAVAVVAALSLAYYLGRRTADRALASFDV